MFSYLAGLTSANDWPYLFWSGIGGFIIQLLVALGLAAWHHQCHTPGCFRWARYDVEGFRRCRKHHPDEDPGK